MFELNQTFQLAYLFVIAINTDSDRNKILNVSAQIILQNQTRRVPNELHHIPHIESTFYHFKPNDQTLIFQVLLYSIMQQEIAGRAKPQKPAEDRRGGAATGVGGAWRV